MSIIEKAIFIEKQGSLQDINNFYLELYEKNDEEALQAVVFLATSNYNGETFKIELQFIGLLAVLKWGIEGIKLLTEKVIESQYFSVKKNATIFLSHISSKSLEESVVYSMSRNWECIKVLEISNEKYKTEDLIYTSREALVEIISKFEPEILIPLEFTSSLFSIRSKSAQEHMFVAMLSRWFKFNFSGLNNYLELILSEKEKNEIVFHNFIKSNPFILEPFHAKIWSKPRFGEALVPDFLIKSMDNTFTIVEIETPNYPIFTQAGELSSKVVHAKRQALDFRNWIIDNHLYANQRFHGIYRPYCLVVIGKEFELNEFQKTRLKQENESTQGILRIVGFDWLYERAKSTLDNLVKYGFEQNLMN